MKKTKKEFISLAEISQAGQSGQPTSVRAVSQEDFDKHRKILDWTFGFIVAVLIICFTSFVVLIIDSWKFHSEIAEKNSRMIEQLQRENQELKFKALANRIEELESAWITQKQNSQSSFQDNKKNQKGKIVP
jgi:predicted PurR-regulated permease PerM